MESTINILNRGDWTQSISDKGGGIAGGTKVEVQATYRFVPAGSKKGQQCYPVPPPLPPLPPLLPLLPGELLSEAPTPKKAFPVSAFQSPTIASHQQNLTGRESGNAAFRFPNPSVEKMVRQAIRRQRTWPSTALWVTGITTPSHCCLAECNCHSYRCGHTHSLYKILDTKSHLSLPPSLGNVNFFSSSITNPTWIFCYLETML